MHFQHGLRVDLSRRCSDMENKPFQFNDGKGVCFEKHVYGDPPKSIINIYHTDCEAECMCTFEPDEIRRLTLAFIRNSLKLTGVPESDILTSKQCRLLGNISIEFYGYTPMDFIAVFLAIMQDVEKNGKNSQYFTQDPDAGE